MYRLQQRVLQCTRSTVNSSPWVRHISSQSTDEIRAGFIKYFGMEQAHTVVPSSSLVPHDPTLLFTNAGMVQFKDNFCELAHDSGLKTATSSQLCVRAGGKHNDLDNVGYTRRHHTFFEMLGNFSFDSYFKEEAIYMAWQHLTRDLQLPQDRLSVSVHHTDKESAKLWAKITGWSTTELEHRLRVCGDEENFWAMGNAGPCGPCTEIFWDQQEIVDGDRWLEIWNLVFMQYNKQDNGDLIALDRPCVDTGMGLERIASILQGVPSNYGTDNFLLLLNSIYDIVTNESYREINLLLPDVVTSMHPDAVAMRVIADHLRAASFLVADGVVPSAQGRGYVLRRIIRRAVTFQHHLGITHPLMTKIFPILLNTMSHVYPHLSDRSTVICRILNTEEIAAHHVLAKGSKILDNVFHGIEQQHILLDSPKAQLPGEIVFDLYHTLGFPFDITQILAKKRGFEVSEDDFNRRMEEQRMLSRESWVGSGDSIIDAFIKDWQRDGASSTFLDHTTTVEVHVVGIHVSDNGDKAWLLLDSSPFYPIGGGQIGDRGLIKVGNTILKVIDTLRPYEGGIVSVIELIDDTELAVAKDIKIGDTVTAIVDQEFRLATSSHHTATHLVQAALQNILQSDGMTQAGSLVTQDRLRFDFTFPRALTKDEIRDVEDWVNNVALSAAHVSIKEMTIEEAKNKNATALFGERYGNIVRVVDIPRVSSSSSLENKDNSYSIELCGGTHVKNTKDIFPFCIVSESSVSTGTRRIEAVVGKSAINRMRVHERDLLDVAQSLNSTTNGKDILHRLDVLMQKVTQLEKHNSKLQTQVGSTAHVWPNEKISIFKELLSDNDNNDNVTEELSAIIYAIPDSITDIAVLRKSGQDLINNDSTNMCILMSPSTGTILIFSPMDQYKKNDNITSSSLLYESLSAKNILNKLIKNWPKEGGRGGGSPNICQGSLPILNTSEKIFETLSDILH